MHKEYGLTKMQIIILNALASSDVLNMTQISEFIGTSKEQATRAVSSLIEKEFVERFVRDNNRTYVEVRLSESGKRFMRYYYQQSERRIIDYLSQYLSQNEIGQLRSSLGAAVNLLMKVK